MSKKSENTAGINIVWHYWNYTTTPGIPLHINAIDALMEDYLQTPARFPGMLYISVPSLTYAPLEHTRSLAIGIARRDTRNLLACFRT